MGQPNAVLGSGLPPRTQECFFSLLLQGNFFLRFYLFIINLNAKRHRERQRHRQREKQALFREPDMGLDPGTPGSRSGLKVALNRCATQGSPCMAFIPTFLTLRFLFMKNTHVSSLSTAVCFIIICRQT